MGNLILSLTRDDPIHFYIDGIEVAKIQLHKYDDRKLYITAKENVEILREKVLKRIEREEQ